MSKAKIMLSAMLLLGVGFTGCASVQKPVVQQKHSYQLNQACPSELTLAVGETLQFTANDNPSTGYAWKLNSAVQHLEATSNYVANKTEGYLVVGAGGVRHFSFKAISAGTDAIDLVYTRSWMPQDIGAQWQCKVTVK